MNAHTNQSYWSTEKMNIIQQTAVDALRDHRIDLTDLQTETIKPNYFVSCRLCTNLIRC